ncbi:hypothetical protein C8Q72DRAFT_807313 [Fomitopsis betulina]|nr:hypothetical protein C8Q72DRAFT_807313 [Fomitopsis betulina]
MMGPSLHRLAPLYLALHITGGHVLLPLLIATLLLSNRVKRHPAVVNFCVTWVIYSVSYSLLLYSGQRHPIEELCMVQLSMIYGSDAMVAAANLALAIQIWSTFYVPWAPIRVSQYGRFVRSVVMLAPPYIIFMAFSAMGLREAHSHPNMITIDNGIYCAMDPQAFSRFTLPVVCGVLLLTASIFEVAVVVRRYSTWRRAKDACPEAYIKGPSVTPCLRVGIFLMYSWVTLGACVFYLSAYESTSAYPYFVQATLPFVTFIVFGMQKDIALAWASCFKRPVTLATDAACTDASVCFQSERSSVGNQDDASAGQSAAEQRGRSGSEV